MNIPEPEKDENDQGPAIADEVSGKEDEKPDFGQSDSSDADPNQGAINLGFDDEDEASKEETEEEEVCIFIFIPLRFISPSNCAARVWSLFCVGSMSKKVLHLLSFPKDHWHVQL